MIRLSLFTAVLALLSQHVSPLDFGGGGGSGEETVTCVSPSILVDGACKVCAAGQYIGTDNCYDCSIGEYSDAESSTSCTACSGSQSTLSEGSSASSDCIDVCAVTLPSHALSVSPVATTNVATTSSITITCDSGYQISGANVHIELCSSTPTSCSGVHVTTTETKVLQGAAMTLTCTVVTAGTPGTNAADCEWLKDATTISGTTGTLSSTGVTETYSCTYVVASTTSANSGEYTCKAGIDSRDELSADSQTVTVLGYTFSTADASYAAGDTLTMSCDVDAPDAVTIASLTWYQGTTAITSGVTTASSGDPRSSVLVKSGLALADSGDYTCAAEYNGIGTLTTAAATVYVIDFSTPLVATTVKTGDPITLTCVVVGDTSAPTVAWTSTATTALSPATETTSGSIITSKLIIATAADGNAGDYTCTGTAGSNSATSTATVQVFAVGFDADPANVEINAGADGIMTCIVQTPSAYPITSSGWYSSGGTQISTVVTTADTPSADKTSLVMTITAATVSDNGQYYCKAVYSDSAIGTLSSGMANLYVNGIVTSPVSINSAVGGTTTLTCVIAGDVSSVAWSFRLENEATTFNPVGTTAPWISSETTDSSALQTTSKLVISTHVQLTQEGYYKATATFNNAATAESATAHMPVIDTVVAQAYGIVGGATTITCVVDAAEEPESVAWTVGGEPIASTVTQVETHDASGELTNSVITIATLAAADFDDYVCIAYFESSTVIVTSNTMTLYLLSISTPNVATSAVLDAAVTLSCIVTYPTGFTAIPTFTWPTTGGSGGTVDYSGAITNTAGTDIYTTKIIFDHVAFTDYANYQCQAAFSGYSGTLSSSFAQLTVEGVFSHPSDLNIVEGSSGAYTCVIYADTTPTMTWIKGSTTVASGIVNTVTSSSPFYKLSSVLTLSSASSTTADTYKCQGVEGSDTFLSNAATVEVFSVITSPTTQSVISAANLVLTCVSGKSSETMTVAWYKGGVAITSGITNSEVSGDWQSTLTVSAVTLSNDGSYYCQVTYECTTSGCDFTGGVLTSSSAQITVITVITEPTALYGQVSSAGALTCVVYGDAQATVAWYKNSAVISTSAPTSSDTYDSSTKYTTSILTWTAMATADGGTYKCRATYTSGSIDSANAAVAVYSVSIEQQPVDQVISNGDSVTFTCIASAPDGKTAPTMAWVNVAGTAADSSLDSKISVITTTDSTTNFQTTSKLIITAIDETSAIANDGYKCKASYTYDSIGTIPSDIAYAYVRRLSTLPEAQTVLLTGGSTTLTCIVEGDEPATFQWYFGGNLLTSASLTAIDTGLYDSSTSSQKSTLFLDLVSTASAGTYNCKTTYASETPTTLGASGADAVVIVLDTSLQTMYGIDGQELTVKCDFTIDSTVTISMITSMDLVSSAGSDNFFAPASPGELGVTVAAATDFATDYWTCVGVYSISSTTYTVTSTAATMTALTATAPSSVTVNLGSAATLAFSADNPTSDISTATWKFTDIAGSQTCTSTLPCTINTDTVYSMSGTITDSATTDNPFISTMVIGTTSASSSYVSIDYTVAFAYTTSGTLTSSAASITVNQFTTHPTAETVLGGTAATLTCVAEGNGQATITWYNGASVWGSTRTGVTQTDTATTTDKTTSELVFSSVTSTDAGDYKCSAAWGSLTLESSTATLTYAGFSSSPSFTKKVKGTAITLSCTLAAYTASVKVEWFKDGSATAITSSGGDTTINTAFDSTYVIASASHATDAGSYQCKATYPADLPFAGGTAETDAASVVIIEVIAESSGTVSVEGVGGDSVSLTCTSVGDAQATSWTWTSGSTAITIDTNKYVETVTYSSTTYETKSVLAINSLASSDAETYKCKASYIQSGGSSLEDELADSHIVTVRWDSMPKQYYMDGSTTTFTCVWNNLADTVSVRKLQQSTDNTAWTDTHDMETSGVSDTHSDSTITTAIYGGYWRCLQTVGGTEFTTTGQQLIAITKTAPAYTTEYADSTTVTDIAFTCKFGTADGTSDEQAATSVTWYTKDGSESAITPLAGRYVVTGPTVDATGVSESVLTITNSVATPILTVPTYVCKMTYSYTDTDANNAAVSFVAEYDAYTVDLVEPTLTRTTTYGMIDTAMLFTCTIDSIAKPLEASLEKAGVSVNKQTTTFGGSASAWTAELTYTPVTGVFADTMTCVSKHEHATGDYEYATSIAYAISEVVMTMTDKVTLGLTGTITCDVTVAAAPESIKWYSDASTEITSSDAATYTIASDAWGTPSGHIISKLTVIGTSLAKNTDATYTCRVSFDTMANAYEIKNTAYIEAIDLTPVNTATVGGAASTATISCGLTLSDKTYVSFGWFSSGTPVTTAGGITVTVPGYSSGSIATLEVAQPTADVTYTCIAKYQADGSNDLSAEAYIDFVIITPTSSESHGGEATISCALTGSLGTTSSVKWTKGSATALVDSDSAYTAVDDGTYGTPANGQTMALTVAAPSSDTTYTCNFLYEIVATTTYVTVFNLAAIDHVVMTAPNMHTLLDKVTVTCTVSAALSGADITWSLSSDGTSPLTTGNDYGVTTAAASTYSDTNTALVSTLEVKDTAIAADVTYHCFALFDSGTKISKESVVDHVSIAITTQPSAGTTPSIVQCVLSDSETLTDSDVTTTTINLVKWTQGDATALTSGDAAITAIAPGTYTSPGQTTSMTIAAPSVDTTYTCMFQYDAGGVDVVSAEVKVDFFTPTLTRTTTYGMKGKDMPFTCTVDSDVKPTEISLTKEASKEGAAVTSSTATAIGGSTNAWTATFSYKASDSYTFGDSFGCIATVETVEGGGVNSGVVSEVTMTMTNRATIGETAETVTCDVGAAIAPQSITWYSDDTNEVVAGNSFTITPGTFGDPTALHQVSTLEVAGSPSAKITNDVTYTCRVSYDSTNAYEILSTAYIEVVTITAVNTATVGGADSTAKVSCKLFASSKEWASLGWFASDGTTAVVDEIGVTDVLVPAYAADTTATLELTEPTLDVTYTCKAKYQADGSNDISVEVIIDFVEITATGATSSGDSTTISCELTKSQFTTASVKWTQSTTTALVDTAAEYTAVDSGTYGTPANGQTIALTIASPSVDITYTCNFVYTDTSNEVSADVIVDFFEPLISRATTYAMLDHTVPFTCTVDSTAEPTSVQLKKGGTAEGAAVTTGFSGAANAWVANFAFTPSTAGDLTADYNCEAIVSGTTAVSINYALSEVVMTMTNMVTTGLTTILTCDVTVAAAPVSIKWYSDASTEITSSDAATYTLASDAYGTPSGHIISKLTVIGTTGSEISADATYTCRVSFDNTNAYEILSNAVLDWVVLTPTGMASTGSVTTVTCVLTESHTTPSSVKWTTGGSTTAILDSATGIASLDAGTYGSNGQTMTIGQTTITADTTYTCSIVYKSDLSNTIEAEALIDYVVITTKNVETVGTETVIECALTLSAATTVSVTWTQASIGSGNTVLSSSDATITNVDDGAYNTPANGQTMKLTVAAPITLDTTYTCSFKYKSDDSNTVTGLASIDHIVMTAPHMHTLLDSVILTCTVSAALSGADITWSSSSTGTPPLTTNGDYGVTTAAASTYTDTNTALVSTLEVKDTAIAADATFYCVATFTSTTVVITETEVDHVSIAVSGTTGSVTSTGASTVISCVLSDSNVAASDDLDASYINGWVDKDNGAVVTASGITVDLGTYASNGQTMKITVDAPLADVDYTCNFNFGSGSTDTVSEIASIDYFSPVLTRATTYGMVDYAVPFTCNIDSTIKPTSVGLVLGGSAISSTAITSGITGAAEAWVAVLTYTPTTSGTDIGAAATYKCTATVDSLTSVSTPDYALSEISMTMVDKHTISGTDATVTCTVTAAAAPDKIDWVDSTDAAITTTAGSYTVTAASNKISTLEKVAPTAVLDTFKCRAYYDTSNEYFIESSATIDVVAIMASSVANDGSATSTITCKLTGAAVTTVSASWSNALGAVTSISGGNVDTGNFASNEQKMEIWKDNTANTASATYTCTFVWSAGVDEVSSTAYFNKLDIVAGALLSDQLDPTISCVVSGAMTTSIATIAWTDTAQQPISADSSYGINSDAALTNTDEQKSILTLKSEADGTYTCTYTYDVKVAGISELKGSVVGTVAFEAITVTMDDYFVDVVGKVATLACAVAEASSEPTITWTDGTTTWDSSTATSASISPAETKYTGEAKTSTLYFTATQASDTKTYTCTITINAVSVTKEIDLYAIDLSWAASYGAEGDSTTKVCSYTDATIAATAVNIKKETSTAGTYDTTGLTLDTMTSSSPYVRTMTAATMAAGDEGNYQCIVETASFTYTSPATALTMLSITQEITAQVITSGSTVSLTCTFENPALYQSAFPSQALSIQWRKDSSDISGAASDPTGSPSSAYYEITTASATTHSGSYECVGTYGTTGVITSTAAVIAVRGVTTEITATAQYAGYAVTLTCVVNGEAEASSVTWRRAGTAISGASPTKTYSAPDTTSVLVQTVTDATDGDYSCLASWGDSSTVTTANAAISVLADCTAGQYLDTSVPASLTCTDCALGTYSESAGLTSCAVCPNSASTLTTASDTHNQCYDITAPFTEYTADEAALTITTTWTSSDTPESIVWVYPNGTDITDTNVIDFANSKTGYVTTAEMTITHFSATDHWSGSSGDADDGAYTCKFMFANAVEKTVVITVEILEITADPADTTKSVGDSFSLTCEGSPAPSGVTVSSQWLKFEEGATDGVNTETSLVNETDTTTDSSKVIAKLIFSYTLSSMVGDYQCMIRYDDSKLYSAKGYLMIAGITSFPASSLAVDGNSVTITAVATGTAAATDLKWYIGGTEFFTAENDRVITTTDAAGSGGSSHTTTSVLVWDNIDKDTYDGSEITVSMTLDGASYTSDTNTLTVLGVYRTLTSRTIMRGLSEYLYCSFDGPPQPTITWSSHTAATCNCPSDTGTAIDSSSATTSLSGTSVYISKLEVVVAADGDATIWRSCKATYSSYSGASGTFAGGSATSAIVEYDTVGVLSISGPSAVRTGSAATFISTVDYLASPNEPTFNWKLNGYPLTNSGTSTQSSTSVSMYEFDITTMAATDAGTYSVTATYASLGTSGSLEITTQVLDACAEVPSPANGVLTCTPSDYVASPVTTVSCTLACDATFQLDGSQSTWTCTDGAWEQSSATNPTNKVARCLQTQDPASLDYLFTANYELTSVASCTSYYGQVMRVAWPYFMKEFTPTSSDVALVTDDDNTWSDTDYSNYCSTSGKEIYLKAKFEQTSNTGTSVISALASELNTYVGNDWGLSSARSASCVDATDDDCIKISCLFGVESLIMSTIKCSARKRRSVNSNNGVSFDGAVGTGGEDGNDDGQTKRSFANGMVVGMEVRCNAGSVPDGVRCVECGPGTFQDVDKCTSCSVGTYQELAGQSTCRPCPGGLGTIGEGSESVDLCDNVCQIAHVDYGTTSPAPGWVVTAGSAVTVKCQDGYQYQGSNVGMSVCGETPACIKVEVTAASVDVITQSAVILTCSVVSAEEPLGCVWYHEQTELSTSPASRSGSDQYECVLTIASATSANAGDYSCSASLTGRQENARTPANINVLEITLDASTESYVEGDNINMFCAVSVPPHTSVSILWTKDNVKVGQVIQSTANPAVHSLNIEDASPSDAGQYRCVAMYDAVGIATSQPKQINILGFLTKISTHSLVTGQSSTLKCTSNEGIIAMKKDGVVIASDAEYVISSASSADAGVYTCTASGTNHLIEATAVVSVTDTGFSTHPADVSATLESTVTFTATAMVDSTHADPTFTWFVNDVATKISNGAASTELTVTSVTERSDVYCTVEYSNGVLVTSKHAVLDVRGFKTHPTHKEHLEGEAVTLQCAAVGDDLQTINWFREIDDNQEYIETNTLTIAGHVTTSTLVTSYSMAYYCQAVYVAADSGTTAIESARAGITQYRIVLDESHAMIGAAETLTCKMFGATKPDLVSWTFNGNSIDASRISESEFDYTKSYGESYLVLDTVTEPMLGEYSCMASFVSSMSFLKSQSVSLSTLGFVDEPTDLIVMRSTQTPKIIFTYTHDNAVVDPKVLCSNINIVAKSTRRDGDIVTFEGTIELPEGVSKIEYDCSIEYADVGTVLSDKVSVHILDPVTLTTATPTAMMGDIVSFTSTVSYVNNPPIMAWKVDNTLTIPSTVTYNETHITSVLSWPAVEDFIVTLGVTQVNVASVVTRTKGVEVIGIKEIVGPVSPMLGRTYNLTCGAVQKSGANIAFQWTQEGEIRQAGSQHMSNGMVRSVLPVYSVDAASLGLYTCTATYSGAVEGQTTATFHLKLTGQCEVPVIAYGGVQHEGVYIDTDTLVEVFCDNGYEASAETVRCVNGVFDTVMPICIQTSSALNVQIVSGLGVLIIVVIVILGVVWAVKRSNRPIRANMVTPSNGFYGEDLKANLGRGSEVHSNFAADRELTVVDVNYNH